MQFYGCVDIAVPLLYNVYRIKVSQGTHHPPKTYVYTVTRSVWDHCDNRHLLSLQLIETSWPHLCLAKPTWQYHIPLHGSTSSSGLLYSDKMLCCLHYIELTCALCSKLPLVLLLFNMNMSCCISPGAHQPKEPSVQAKKGVKGGPSSGRKR